MIKLNGILYIIWGNHNSGIKQLYHKWKKELFQLIPENLENPKIL